MKITEEHKKLLAYINDDWSSFYKQIVRETKMPKKKLRAVMLELKIAGYVYYSVCVDEDGIPKGSTHFLTDKGVELKERLKIEDKVRNGEDIY